QFYSNEDIDRLIEEQIAFRENLALKKLKEISGYLPSQNPPCRTQVNLNTKAMRQLLEVMKHAKKTLAKKPGPGREKADKICVDHFLDKVLKNMGEDPDSNDQGAELAKKCKLKKKLYSALRSKAEINDLNKKLLTKYLEQEKELQQLRWLKKRKNIYLACGQVGLDYNIKEARNVKKKFWLMNQDLTLK
ncbi:4382_t:CDS:2, partial [Gigaspora margarita]